MATITRKGTFDAAHRVMNEKMKCFNLHGHTYLYELTFGYEKIQEIGYAIDFKEIKRVMMQWIDDYLDHAVILNPEDHKVIQLANELGSKLWIMTLNGKSYCNPTVENIAKEVFLGVHHLTEMMSGLWLVDVRIYETPNCFVDEDGKEITEDEQRNWLQYNGTAIAAYSKLKGKVNYDDRIEQ